MDKLDHGICLKIGRKNGNERNVGLPLELL